MKIIPRQGTAHTVSVLSEGADMLRYGLAVLAATVATPSAGQTNCRWVGQTWFCNGQQPQTQLDPSILLRAGGLNNPGRLAQERQEQLRTQQMANNARQAENHARNQRLVGQMISNGKCDVAVKYALQEGELDLAQQAKSMCGQ